MRDIPSGQNVKETDSRSWEPDGDQFPIQSSSSEVRPYAHRTPGEWHSILTLKLRQRLFDSPLNGCCQSNQDLSPGEGNHILASLFSVASKPRTNAIGITNATPGDRTCHRYQGSTSRRASPSLPFLAGIRSTSSASPLLRRVPPLENLVFAQR